MHLKTSLITVIILTIIIFPSASGNFKISEQNKMVNDANPLEDATWVKFCYGTISNLYEIRSGYTTYAMGFNADDVICIINYSYKPIYHHFTHGEKLAIPLIPSREGRLRGGMSDDFIYANYGFLSPKILLLIYHLLS